MINKKGYTVGIRNHKRFKKVERAIKRDKLLALLPGQEEVFATAPHGELCQTRFDVYVKTIANAAKVSIGPVGSRAPYYCEIRHDGGQQQLVVGRR